MLTNDRKSFVVDLVILVTAVGAVSYTTSCSIRRDFNKRSDDFKAQYDRDQANVMTRRRDFDKWRADLALQDTQIEDVLGELRSQGVDIRTHSGQWADINAKINAIMAAEGIADPTTRPVTQP